MVLEDSWSKLGPAWPCQQDWDSMDCGMQRQIAAAAAWGGVKALKQAKSLAVSLKAALNGDI